MITNGNIKLCNLHLIHTVPEGAIEVSQVEAGGAPIQVVLLFFQHLCQPL